MAKSFFQVCNENNEVLSIDWTPLVFNEKRKEFADRVSQIVDDRIINNPQVLTIDRETAHREWYWHRACHTWVFSKKGDILVQKRGEDKDLFPGMYDISAAGHIDHTQDTSAIGAALREMKEELGLEISPEELIPFKIRSHQAYIADSDGNIKQKNFEHDYVYFHEVESNDLKQFNIGMGDTSDQEEGKEKTPEVAWIQFINAGELEKEVIANFAEAEKDPSKLKFVPPMDYWLEVIAEVKNLTQWQS